MKENPTILAYPDWVAIYRASTKKEKCKSCDGTGESDHQCGCEYCDELVDCHECGGSGDSSLSLTKYEAQQKKELDRLAEWKGQRLPVPDDAPFEYATGSYAKNLPGVSSDRLSPRAEVVK